MKKKVRYAAGAVAAAVPALGLMMPAAATAAPVHRPAPSGKTVRLHQSQRAVPDTGCTASSEVHRSTGKGHIPNQALTYWWKRNVQEQTCIGTVEGQVSNASLQGQTVNFRVRVYLSGHQKVSDVVHGTCYKTVQAQCTGVKAAIGVHKWIGGDNVNVCGAWLWATGPFKGTEAWGPMCKSVP